MEVQVEKTGSYTRKVSVTLDADVVEKAFEAALRKTARQAQVPGFRPGKIPKQLIERQYGASIRQDVQNQLVDDTLYQAMDEHGIAPVAIPRLQVGTLNRGAMFAYTAEVEVRPDIELQDYKGLTAPAADDAAPEAEVEQAIETMRKQAAQLVPVLARDLVQDGDVVQIDYVGTLQGVAFEGGKAENAMVEIGAGDYIPGFAEGLVGAKVPSERTLDITFPDDYGSDHLRGKTAQFAVTLKELKERDLPLADDEFAKDMGHDSLALLQEHVKQGISGRKQQEGKLKQREALLKDLVGRHTFDVPPSMVESQTDRLVASAAARVERMVGQKVQLKPEQLAELRNNSQAEAEFQVRSGLLLLEIARAEKIAVAPDEISTEVDRMANEVGDEHADNLRRYYEDPGRREELEFRLLEDKVVDFLLSTATLSPAAAGTE